MARADGTRSRSGTHTLTREQRGLGASYSRLRPQVFATYGTACYWCHTQTIPAQPRQAGRPRDPRERTVDHLIPRSHGGTNDLTNLRPACWRCNSSRGKRARPLTRAAARTMITRAHGSTEPW